MRKTAKRFLAASGIALALSALMLTPVAAHQAPCEDLGPGESTYAQHHIVPLATTGELGAGGHIPGEHMGYAGLCGVLAP